MSEILAKMHSGPSAPGQVTEFVSDTKGREISCVPKANRLPVCSDSLTLLWAVEMALSTVFWGHYV